MANPNRFNNTLETALRAIVREEFRNIVNAHGSEDEESTQYTPNIMSRQAAGRLGGLAKKRKGKASKGSVTNPSTDRRLKKNRDASL